MDAIYDLGGIAGCYFLIALLEIVSLLADALAIALDFSIFGVHPLAGVSSAIRNSVVRGADDGIKALERTAATFESGLIVGLGIILSIPYLLSMGVRSSFEYLWYRALKPLIHSIVEPVRTLVQAADATISGIERSVAEDVIRAETYAQGQAVAAFDRAKHFSESAVRSAANDVQSAVSYDVAQIEQRMSSLFARAESYADTAVDKLRAAEQSALANVEQMYQSAQQAIGTAERYAIQTAETEAERQLVMAEATAAQALAGVRGIAVTAEDDLKKLYGQFGLAGTAGLIAAIPALGTLVHTIATESGLENQSCRAKVKDVCATSAPAWASFIDGLAILTGVVTLSEIVDVARPLVPVGADLLKGVRG